MLGNSDLRRTCGDRCAHCGRMLDFNAGTILFEDSATKEHVIPKSKGGSNKHENIVLLCRRCNLTRKNADIDVFWYYRFLPVPKFVQIVSYLQLQGCYEQYSGGRKWVSAKEAERVFKEIHEFAMWSITARGVGYLSEIAGLHEYCLNVYKEDTRVAKAKNTEEKILDAFKEATNEAVSDEDEVLSNPIEGNEYISFDEIFSSDGDENFGVDEDELRAILRSSDNPDEAGGSAGEESEENDIPDLEDIPPFEGGVSFKKDAEGDRFSSLFSPQMTDIVSVMERTGGKCAHCGQKYNPGFVTHELLPWRLGGEDVLQNSVILCPECQSRYFDMLYLDLEIEFPKLKEDERVTSIKYIERRLNRAKFESGISSLT